MIYGRFIMAIISRWMPFSRPKCISGISSYMSAGENKEAERQIVPFKGDFLPDHSPSGSGGALFYHNPCGRLTNCEHSHKAPSFFQKQVTSLLPVWDKVPSLSAAFRHVTSSQMRTVLGGTNSKTVLYSNH